MPTETANPTWIALATLIRPQGRRGELLAEMETDLRELFTDGLEVTLSATETPSAAALATALESHWFPTGKNAGRIVLKLGAANSISEAESLQGRKVLIPSAALPDLGPDTWFVRDLVGCTLMDGAVALGEIVDVEFSMTPDGRSRLEDAAPFLVVIPGGVEEMEAGEENDEAVLVPLIRAWVDEVDVAGKVVRMHLPEGLFKE